MINNQNNIVNGGVVNMVLPPSQSVDLGTAFLTPDALMSYCATRLRGLDEQIQAGFEKQRAGNDDSKILSQLNDDLGAGPSTGEWDQKSLQLAMADAGAKLKAAAAKVPDPLKQQLLDQADKCAYAASHQTSMTGDQYKKLTSDPVSNMQKDLNSGTELAMISLQSLMSQRQSSVQMITNMVQSLGDQMNKIAANIGH